MQTATGKYAAVYVAQSKPLAKLCPKTWWTEAKDAFLSAELHL
jgi:hypothetical protein